MNETMALGMAQTLFDHSFLPPAPIRALIYGVVLGEVYQWGSWKAKNGGQKWLAYWNVGLPHLMVNLFIIVAVAALWSAGMLDKALAMIPGTGDWANTGVPFTPPIGLLLGIGADIGGDQIAFLARKTVGSRLPFLGGAHPEPPPGEAPR